MNWPETIRSGETEQLEPLVRRVLANNPSPYTYSGTQTYLVGLGRDLAVIDPGPDDVKHIDTVLEAAGDARISAILCTHTHRDHSPAAALLKERTGAMIIGCAPLTLDDDGPRADAAFDASYRPDHILSDNERVSGDGWTLEAVTTPGHTSNHLCFGLIESGALFTGDHIMKWSTSVISPPDGDMGAYMASLAKLHDREDRIFFPAHGPAAEKPRQLVRGMIGHRRQRERQILRLLESESQDISQFVAAMYKGLDSRLQGAAGRSVQAHLLDMSARGMVAEDEGRWQLIAS